MTLCTLETPVQRAPRPQSAKSFTPTSRVLAELEPIFDSKRSNFLIDYGLETLRVLVWQAMPTVRVISDDFGVSAQKMLADIGEGQPPVRVFEGWAANRKNRNIGWNLEIHEDGHVIGGLWFPASQQGLETPNGGDFQLNKFEEFGQRVAAIYATAEISENLVLTCSMRRADQFLNLNHGRRIEKSSGQQIIFAGRFVQYSTLLAHLKLA